MESPPISRRTFHSLAGATLLAATTPAEIRAASESHTPLGPLVGHVDRHSAMIWARLRQRGQYRVVAAPAGKASAAKIEALATTGSEVDYTAQWQLKPLDPQTRYEFTLYDPAGKALAASTFRTAPDDDQPARVTLALGSCAKEDAGTRAVWRRMATEAVDGVLLMGDTPYIDSTDLATQRRRYREFAAVSEYQQLLASRPHWATWDDHDFGRNDCDGRLAGKEHSRQAFTEYRALPSYGDGKQGIYTSFRYGPIEVFLIDTRWFSRTAPSFADPQQKTLLGGEQWQWLQRGLKASTAPFKLLGCGFIWDDKGNKESDDWAAYPAERAAVFDFIRREKIPGVVLFGGDIHVTRLLRYPAESSVGYPLVEFISSPMHASVIPELNVPHAALIASAIEPNTFLKLTADSAQSPATLTAEFINRNGIRLFAPLTLTTADLTPAS